MLMYSTTARPDASIVLFLEGDDSHLRNKLEEYIKEEYPFYSEADIVVETKEEAVENTVLRVLDALNKVYSVVD